MGHLLILCFSKKQRTVVTQNSNDVMSEVERKRQWRYINTLSLKSGSLSR